MRSVRNRTAVGQRDQPRASPPADAMIHLIAMDHCSALGLAKWRCLRRASPQPGRIPAVQIAIRPGAPHQGEQIVLGEDPRTQPPPRSVAPGYPAALAESPAGRVRLCGWRAPARRIRSSRRGCPRTIGPWAARPPNAPTRPTRCRATPIERGEPIWHTRSTLPISMPNSSDAVATTTRSSPFFKRCSASRRNRRERLP